MPRRQSQALGVVILLAALSLAATGVVVARGGGPAVVQALADVHQALAARWPVVLALFAVWALIANCLVVPAGSLSLIAGGALLGWLWPSLVWFLAQLVTAPLLHRIGAAMRPDDTLDDRLGSRRERWLALARRDGILASMVLRVIPVVPSAPAALIAGGAGISLRHFMTGSVLAGWLRPVYFASLGAGLTSLASWREASGWQALVPLSVAAVALAGLLALRLWLGARSGIEAGEQRP